MAGLRGGEWGRVAALISLAAAAAPALAQRTGNNATTQADDAFGKSVGDQSIGIYNSSDVRGFSPIDAGNVRIEGLYFDQQASLRDRIVAYSTIRVGLSAQSYPFPAPTGIADYSLRRPGAKPLVSVGLTYGPWGGTSSELDVQLPLQGDRLGLAAGVAYYTGASPYDGTPRALSTGVVGRWVPAEGVEILSFWSHYVDRDDEAQPLIFTAGPFLPARVPRNTFRGQKWADYALTQDNFGTVVIARPFGLDLRLGAFRSISATDKSAADLMLGSDAQGAVANRVIVIENGDRNASTSGELRLAKGFDTGPVHHTIAASARARAQDRRYGGATNVALGASRYDVPDFRPEPTIVDGPKTSDRVRQTTFGLTYQAKWRDRGEMSLGLQRSNYTKRVAAPTVQVPESKSDPWLPSATAAIYLTPAVVAYAGYTRGLEESPVAPTEAVNLNEAPPAILTEQKDGGVRWTISPGLTAVLGVFEVAKPYYNLDAGLRFRRLGEVSNRGVEFSVAGRLAKGLSLVLGNVMVYSRVSGDQVDRGVIGRKPVASFVRHTIGSIDYRLPFYEPVSFDLFMESTSKRVADAANSFYIPARSVFHLGGRYRFKVAEKPVLLRWQVQNLTNVFGWSNGRSGYFVPNGSRRWLVSLAGDF